ncbi:trans-sulfuration enzyme family protein [candidate division KSB1 bacterium]
MTNHRQKLKFRTLSVHAGEKVDPSTNALTPNLVMSTSFSTDADASFSVEGLQEDAPFLYTRWGNPTVNQLQEKLAALENAESCLAFSSGMSAITALFFYCLSPGDHLVISDVTYAAAAEITNDLLPGLGIKVTKVNMSDLDELHSAITQETKLIYIETPCNPILRLTDISAVAEIARTAGAKLAVDSTFATPVATQPVSLGADYSVHSLTKYLCGHGDAIGGALIGTKKELSDLHQKIAMRTGGILSPFNAWIISRGIATFPLRMEAHEYAALEVGRFLEQHPKVTKVIYPGLPSHPQHELAKRQMNNFSGMLTFQVNSGADAAKTFAEKLNIIHYAVSLGHQRSLLFYLATEDMLESSFKLTASQLKSYREFAGDGIFRLSVGIEDPADLCDDLEHVLSAI